MLKTKINPLDIYKSLNKSNCRDCLERTCFAFASLVAQGHKKISDCPHITKETFNAFNLDIDRTNNLDLEPENFFSEFKNKVREIDFNNIAEKLGAKIKDGKLVIQCLGKNFIINRNGDISSSIHVHSWITGPILNYITKNSINDPIGKWILFRELSNGKEWNPLYMQRCEKPLLKIADENESLFSLLIGMFGKRVKINEIEGDIIFLIYPLPKVPFVICYSRMEEEFESKLNFYYDANIEDNLNIESIYSLGTGFVLMIEKFMKRHSR